jgi:hypothetical protein
LGFFSVEFQMLGDHDTNPPDDEMLRRASALASYAERHGDFILDIVFGHYLFAAEDHDWLNSCGIPHDLSRDRIADSWDEPYASTIHIVPLWDEEHAFSLLFRGGAIVAAIDSRFNLEAGILRWIKD